MKEYFGIAITDGRNRNNQELTFDAMCNAYYKTWNKPLPMHIGHDRTKPIGYTYLNGIYMEPGKAYATNTARLIETEEEQKKLIKIIDNISYVEHCNHHKEEIEILLKKLNCHVIGKYSVIPTYQAVAINNENIVSRVFPEMVSHINDGLIDLREIEPVYSVNSSGEKGTLIPGVYKKDSYLLFAHRFFRRNLSILNTTNDLFFSLFEKMRSNSELKLQISLDMDMIGLLGTEKTELEYQYQRGPYFNNDLEKIPLGVTCLTNEKYDNLFSNLVGTQFYWYSQDGKKTFECEELCDRENISLDGGKTMMWGCRYVHSMLNPNTNLPNHLDGAIRIYNDEQILERIDNKTDISKYEKGSKYVKLWRIDNDFSVEEWKKIISSFYRENLLIEEYFGGVDEKYDQIIKSNETNVIGEPRDFEHIELKEDEGLRIFFHLSEKKELPEDRDVLVINRDYLINREGEKIKILDSETITLLKLLQRKKLSLRIPFTTLVDFGDMIYNFPTLLCRNNIIANSVIEAVYELCVAWTEKGDDRLISFGIMVGLKREVAHISFVGHVSDFKCFFSNKNNFIDDSVEEFINRIYQNNNTFKKANNTPNVYSILNGDKVCFKRIIVNPKYINKKWMEDGSVNVELNIKKDKIDYLQKHKITTSPFFIIKESKCLNCGDNYINCDCVKFIDKGVIDEPIDIEYKGLIWTNRNASYPNNTFRIIE